MAVIQEVDEIYQDNFNNFYKTRSEEEKITTVYNVSLISSVGISLFNARIYSKFLPDIKSLDECLEDKSDLTSGFTSALLSYSSETHKNPLQEYVIKGGRVIKIFPITDNYMLEITYDRNDNNYQKIEELINNLCNKAKETIIKNYSDMLEKFEKAGSGEVSMFGDMELELIKIFNLGYNNKKSISYVNNLKKELESHSKAYSFLREAGIEQARENIEKLKKFKKLFPHYNINLEYYEKSIENTMHHLVEEESKKEELKNLSKEIISYANKIISYTKNPDKYKIETLAHELRSPIILENVRCSEKKILSKADLLEELSKNFENNKVNIQMECLEIKDVLSSYLINYLKTTN